jgi:hypothetical protein
MTRAAVAALALVALAAPALAAQPGGPATGNRALYLRSLAPEPRARPQAAAIDPAARPAATALAKGFGVRVLAAGPTMWNGKPAYRMVVMNGGGDFDDAYAVHVLVVDAATGRLVPQFQNEVSGYRLAAPPDRATRDNGIATTIRRESFFKP